MNAALCSFQVLDLASMDGRSAEGVVDVPSIQAVHSQDAMVADLLQQAAEAGGVVQGQAGVGLEQGSVSSIVHKQMF